MPIFNGTFLCRDWQFHDRLLDKATNDLITLAGASDEQSSYEAASHAILDESLTIARLTGEEICALLVWDGKSRGTGDLTEGFGVAAKQRRKEPTGVCKPSAGQCWPKTDLDPDAELPPKKLRENNSCSYWQLVANHDAHSIHLQLYMGTKRRVFISVPDDRHLDERRQQVKRAVISAVANQNLSPVGFEPEQFGTGELVNSEDWTVDKAGKLISHCDGAVILALARTHARILKSEHDKDRPDQRIVSALPTAYNHLEGALALSQRLPVLIVLEENMDRVGIFGSGVKAAIMPKGADRMWVESTTFKGHLESWTIKVHGRRDAFLGYCSKANSTARGLRDYLESRGFTVLDWARDFRAAGSTILEEIEKAAIHCRCAVFLFTRDDEIPAKTQAKANFDAIPRDNVLLEAGYFTQARGKERVAIIREKGAKMPADLGGIIYLSIEDRGNLLPVKRGLVRFLNDAL